MVGTVEENKFRLCLLEMRTKCGDRQKHEQTDRLLESDMSQRTLKTRVSIVLFIARSHRGIKQPRNTIFHEALRTDGQTDGRT